MNMEGKICLVTGASAGIGRATALELAQLGATVVMVCRNPERGETALDAIRQQSGNSALELLLADLSSQAEIRRLAAAFTAAYPALHVLVNNAGIILPRRTLTADGLETQFAVNHLAYFLLTHLLLARLKASAPSRIVNVASRAHWRGHLDFTDLQAEHAYHPTRVYARTKLANLLFTYELARRLQGTQVTVNCLHPGVIATPVLRNYLPGPLRFLTPILGTSPENGARTCLYLATSPEVEGVSGRYFSNCKPARSSPASHDGEAAARLWQVSAALTGLSS